MDLFEMAVKLTTSGDDEVNASLETINTKGQAAAETLSGSLGEALTEVGKRLVELAGIYESYDTFKRMIEEAGQLAMRLEVFSQQTGISAEHLAELGEAAELNYVPVDSLRSAFLRLAMSMGDSQSRGYQAMKAMGLNVESFHGDTEKAFDAIAEKFANYRDDANKSALQTALFGRGGQMTPLLNNLKQTQAEVRALGQTMTDEQKASMLGYEQSMIRLKIVTDGFGRQVAAEAAGPLSALADAFTLTITNGEKFNVVAEVVTGAIRFIGTVAELTKYAFNEFANAVVLVLNEAINAWKAFNRMLDPHGFKDGIAQGLAGARQAYQSFNAATIKDAADTRAELAKLYGLDGDTTKGPSRTPGTTSAPAVRAPKQDDDAKDQIKSMLAMYKEEAEAAQSTYNLQVKLEEDSADSTEQKWAKIKLLDAGYLAFVTDMYDQGSKEYNDQLTHQEELRKKFDDMELKEAIAQTERLNKLADEQSQEDEKRMKEREKKALEISKEVGKGIEDIMKASFTKGSTIGSIAKEAEDVILGALGSMLVKQGEAYLAQSTIMLALTPLLSNPFTSGGAALGIGLALIALGSALGAIASGGGGGGGGGGPVGPPSAVNFGSSINLNGNAATAGSQTTPATPLNVTVIGPNDPQAQRQITELINKASAR